MLHARFRTRLVLGAGAAVLAAATALAMPQAQDGDAALKGITVMGVVVEELGSQSVSCGMSKDAIEQVVTKIVADAGVKVTKLSDEDTYLYVNVGSVSTPDRLCVTRYDVTLNTHTTAKMAYSKDPALVEVTLLRGGGLASGPVAGHADQVMKNITQNTEALMSHVRAANAR